MARFRKRPVEIEAIQYLGSNAVDAVTFLGGQACEPSIEGITIMTLEGNMLVQAGDWIIKGIKGEFYPCKPDIFEATYERIG